MHRLFEERQSREPDAPTVLRLRADPSGPQLFQLVAGSIIGAVLVAKFVDGWPTYPGWTRLLAVAVLVFTAGVLIDGLYTWLTSWIEVDSTRRRVVVHRNTFLKSVREDLPFEAIEAVAVERSHERVTPIHRLVLRLRRTSQVVVSSWQFGADALRESARELSQRIGCRLDEAD